MQAFGHGGFHLGEHSVRGSDRLKVTTQSTHYYEDLDKTSDFSPFKISSTYQSHRMSRANHWMSSQKVKYKAFNLSVLRIDEVQTCLPSSLPHLSEFTPRA